MKYLFPILFMAFAVFFAFSAVKYGPSVVGKTSQLSAQAAKSKPVASFIKLIFSR